MMNRNEDSGSAAFHSRGGPAGAVLNAWAIALAWPLIIIFGKLDEFMGWSAFFLVIFGTWSKIYKRRQERGQR
jgi:hypothetical protein